MQAYRQNKYPGQICKWLLVTSSCDTSPLRFRKKILCNSVDVYLKKYQPLKSFQLFHLKIESFRLCGNRTTQVVARNFSFHFAMEETDNDNTIPMGDDVASGGSDGDSSANCDETDALLLPKEGISNVINNMNNDESSKDGTNELVDQKDINPVIVNNLRGNHENAEPISLPKRYLQIEGYDGRRNDIVYCKPLNTVANSANNSLESNVDAQTPDENRPRLIAFFGGDIQVKQIVFNARLIIIGFIDMLVCIYIG